MKNKYNTTQQRISLFLLVVMLLSFFAEPISVFAQSESVKEGSIIDSDNLLNDKEGNNSLDNKDDGSKTVKRLSDDDRFIYEQTDKGLFITGYKDDRVDTLVIPSSYNGESVVGIAKNALQDLSIKSVNISDNIKYIDDYAFADNNLEIVHLPNNLIDLGEYAFSDNNISDVYIHESKITSIKKGTFAGNNIVEINIANSLIDNVDQKAFINNKQYINIKGKDVGSYISNSKEYGHVSNTSVVTVKHEDENGNKIAADEILGDNFKAIDGSGILFKNKDFKYKPVIVNGYELLNKNIIINTNKDNDVYTVKYKKDIVNLEIEFINIPKYIDVDSNVSEKELLSYVKAYDSDGNDISDTVKVVPNKIDTSVMNSKQTVTFTATDKKGNKISKQHTFIISEDMMKFPVGGGWVLGDFTYGNENEDVNYNRPFQTVTGLSEQGKAKLEAGNTKLHLPTKNPYNNEPITNIDTRLVNNAREGSKIIYYNEDYNKDFTNITELYNVDNIEHISSYAFAKSKLTGEFPFNNSKVKTIGWNAFGSSKFTGDLNLPYVNEIKGNALYQSTFNGAFVAPQLKTVGENALQSSVFIGEFNASNIEHIDNYAFAKSKFAKSLNTPKLKYIGEYALKESKFTGNLITSDLEYIGNQGLDKSEFTGTLNLDKVTYIGNSAFYNSIFEGDFDLPKVEYIGSSAFAHSKFTGNFNAPEVIEIGWDAFANSVNYAYPNRSEGSRFTGTFNAPKVQIIRSNAFVKAQFTGDFITPDLSDIGNNAFYSSLFNGDFIANKIKTIPSKTFYNSGFRGKFEAGLLQVVEDEAFRSSKFTSEFNAPLIERVGNHSFRESRFTGSFNGQNLTSVGNDAFYMSEFIGDFIADKATSLGTNSFNKSKFDGSFSANSATEIKGNAFKESNFKGDFSTDNVRRIEMNAFYNSSFENRGPISLMNIEHILPYAFNSMVDNKQVVAMGTKIRPGKQEFVSGTFRYTGLIDQAFGQDKVPIPIHIIDSNGNMVNPHSIRDGRGYTINKVQSQTPIMINVKYVDLAGNKIAEDEVRFISSNEYEPKNILGYEKLETSYDVSKLKTNDTLTVIYKEVDYKTLNTPGIELSQSYGNDNQSHYYIGSKMVSNVSLSLTGFDKELKNPKVRVFFDENINASQMNVPINDTILSYKVNTKDNYIDVELHKDNIGGTNITFPLRDFTFKRYDTPSNVEQTFFAVLFDGDKAVQSSNKLTFTGYYNQPRMTKYAENNEGSLVLDKENGPRDFGSIKRIPNTTIERVDKEKDVVFYFDTLSSGGSSTIERNVSKFIIKDKLPTYIAIDDKGKETIKTAVFNEKDNPGWILSKDGDYVIYESEIFKKTLRPTYPKLKLQFPHIKNGYQITNNASIELVPDNKGATEDNMIISDSISIYPTDTTKPNPTGEHHFSKHHIGKPRLDLSDNKAYFYDILEDREKEMPYEITFGSKNKTVSLKNVRITDYKLDERMYFDNLVLPIIDNVNVSVMAYKRVGDKIDNNKDTLLEAYRFNLSKENIVNFQSKDIDYFQVVFDNDYVLEGLHALTVNAKLRNPEKEHYSSNNQFYNDAVLSGTNFNKKTGEVFGKRGDLTQDMGGDNLISKYDPMFDNIPGNFFWAESDHIDIKDVSNSVSLGKRQEFYYKDENGNDKLDTSSSAKVNSLSNGKYILSLKSYDAIMFEDYKDFILIDYLPNEIEVIDYTLSTNFLQGSKNGKAEIIKNFENTGKDALVITADILDKNVHDVVTINVRVKDDVKNASSITNKAKASWSNNKIYKDGVKGQEWTEARVDAHVVDSEMVMAYKSIRNINGPWLQGITTKNNETFDYKLTVINKSKDKTSNIEIVDVFPYENDISIQELNVGTNNRPKRDSELANTFDVNRKVVVPSGYTVEYYNSSNNIDYKGKSADDRFNELNWSTSPSVNTKAIRIKSNKGVTLDVGEKIDIIIPMKAPANNDMSLSGKRAWNTFVRKDDTTNRFLEPNRVYNEMDSPKGSIEIVKYGKKGLLDGLFGGKALEGARFEIRDRDGKIIATKSSGSDGKVKFDNLAIGKAPFIIKEIEAPKGYFPSNNILTIGVDDFLNVSNYNVIKDTRELFLNRMPYTGSLILEKKDNKGDLMNNIKFNIKGLDEHNKHVNIIRYTDNKGKIEVNGLTEGRYLLEEDSLSSDGLGLVPIKPIEFNIDSDGKVVDFTGNNAIINNKAIITINKLSVNSDFDLLSIKDIEAWKHDKLSGYAFDIVDDKGESKTIYVDKYGTALVEVDINTKYTIKENTDKSIKDDNHIFNTNSYSFIVDNTGSIVDVNGEKFKDNAVNMPNPQTPLFGEVEITKTGDDNKLLEGAEFALFDMFGKETEYVSKTDNKGKAHIKNINPGAYMLKEIKAPKGYINNFNDKLIVIDRYGDNESVVINQEDALVKKYEIGIVNPKIDIEFIKGEDISITTLNDAKDFVLNNPEYKYRIDNKGQVVIYKPLEDVIFNINVNNKQYTKTTDIDGRLDFSDIDITENSLVTVTEIKTLENYQIDSKPIVVDLSLEKNLQGFTGYISRYHNNSKILGEVIISKYDKETKEKLSGVEFSILKGDEVIESKITNDEGYIIFDNLELDTDYTIRETKPLEGYLAIDDIRVRPTSDESNFFISVYNEKEVLQTDIVLVKVDGNTNEPLKDAEFTLYDKDNNIIQSKISDDNGKVMFSNILITDIENGAYIKETKAPEGYRLNSRKLSLSKEMIKDNVIELGNIENYKSNISLPETGKMTMLYMLTIIVIGALIINKKELF